MSAIYIHIPFCQSRCIYCDFYSTSLLDHREAYVKALVQEMKQRREELPIHARAYHTLYIGGGTPSTLSPELLRELILQTIELFPLEPNAEVTVEANPDDVTPEWVAMLKETPVNRISMGTQTFNDKLLRFLHRRHDSTQAQRAVHRLKEAGYGNISVDLIYGIPGQTKDIWKQDVETALQLDVPHLSAYSLMYEEGTALYRLLEKGEIVEVDEETSLWCYNYLCQQLCVAGYEHYEISNFARPGYHSRHNSSYWQGIPYLGFGAGAHSYDGQHIRRWNEGNLMKYIEHGPSIDKETLSNDDLYNEFVMTRLRTSQGIDTTELARIFGKERLDYCLKQAHTYLNSGELKQMGEHISLTQQGIFISNQIISELFC